MTSPFQIKHGPSLFTWFLIFISLVLLLIAGFRFAPAYVEHRYVVSALHSLQKDPSLQLQQSTSDSDSLIQNVVLKRLRDSGVINVKKNNIQVFYAKNGNIYIRVIYIIRVPLVGNIYFNIPFSDSVAIPK